MSIYPFGLPRIPVSTGDPTSFTHATTILELVDKLRVQIDQLSKSLATYSGSLDSLIGNINDSMGSVLAACQKLATDAADKNSATGMKIDTAIADLAVAQKDIDQTMTAATAAIADARQVLASYQDDVARQDADIASQFATINALVSEIINSAVRKGDLAFNVRDYGAVGDGVTDDTTAINKCIAAANRKGFVFFPAGQYVITQPISFPNDSMIQGVGTYDWQTGNPTNCILVNVPTSAYTTAAVTVGINCNIRDLTFKGSNTGTGLYCSGSCTFSNVNVQGFDLGMQCTNLWYGHFNNLRMLYNNAAVNMNYCYNCTFLEPRFTCRNWENKSRRGFTLTDKMELKIIGGAIESYDTAFKFDTTPAAQSLYCSGVYFEANAPVADYQSPYGAIVINAEKTVQTSVRIMGCHMYINNTKSFIRFNQSEKCVLVSIGNKIKGSANGTYSQYYAESNGAGHFSRVMLGDDTTSFGGATCVYVTPPPSSESYSLIVMPFGTTSQ